MSMSFDLTMSIICDAICIAGFAMNLHISKQSQTEKWRWVIIALALVISFGYTVYNSSELERINNIHRQATAIYNDYNSYGSNKEFIQESLAFLEENQDRYPDSYDRALQIYFDMKNSVGQYDSEPAREIRGILKGIATLNGK